MNLICISDREKHRSNLSPTVFPPVCYDYDRHAALGGPVVPLCSSEKTSTSRSKPPFRNDGGSRDAPGYCRHVFPEADGPRVASPRGRGSRENCHRTGSLLVRWLPWQPRIVAAEHSIFPVLIGWEAVVHPVLTMQHATIVGRQSAQA